MGSVSELAKPDELDQGIVLGWSLGRDPDSKARAYLARWIPLRPGIKSGAELPVYTRVYEARIRRSSGLGLLSLVLAGPLGALVGLLPEGQYAGLGVVVVGLILGATWWRRAPSLWDRGAFVRLLGEAVDTVPQLVPLAPRVAVTGAPPAPPPSTPPPVLATGPHEMASLEPVGVWPQAGPAVPRMPISQTPDWTEPRPGAAIKSPTWAPTDGVFQPGRLSGVDGDPTPALPAWPPGGPHPMGGSFETLIGTTDTQPPMAAPAGAAPDGLPPIVPAGRRTPQAELSIDGGPDAGRTYGAGGSPVKVGRAPDNDFVLVDPRTSRHHAQIELRGDQFWIVDLASANGTLVNNERVSEKELSHGDLIRIGQNKFRFRLVTPELSLI